jgi:hypothetical protein
MKKIHTAVVITAACLLKCPSLAQQANPLTGSQQFPQFRNLSGLAGGGYGVDINGRPSLEGPVAYSTPVAYVLGHDHFFVAGAKTSYSAKPQFKSVLTDGTVIGTFGHTFGNVNVTVTDMLLSEQNDQAFNFQFEYIPPASSRWAASVGVQDAGGGGGSAGNSFPDDGRSSRSVFAVATYRTELSARPLYLSAGMGTNRFKRPFGSISYPLAPHLRAWMEHDGYGFNTGGLFTMKLGEGRRTPDLNVGAGFIKSRYFTFSAGLGF